MQKCSVDFSTAFSYENAVSGLSTAFSSENAVSDLNTAFSSDNAILDIGTVFSGEKCCVESIIKDFRQANIINYWWVKNSLSFPILKEAKSD